MLAILFKKKRKKMLVFPKNGEKNASTIEKGLDWTPVLRTWDPVFETYIKEARRFSHSNLKILLRMSFDREEEEGPD